MPTFSARQDMIQAVKRQAYPNAAVCDPLALAFQASVAHLLTQMTVSRDMLGHGQLQGRFF